MSDDRIPSGDDDLEGRLGAYFDDLAATPSPRVEHLRVTGTNRATEVRDATPWFRRPAALGGLAAVAAALVLALVLARPGDGSDVTVGPAATAPATSTTAVGPTPSATGSTIPSTSVPDPDVTTSTPPTVPRPTTTAGGGPLTTTVAPSTTGSTVVPTTPPTSAGGGPGTALFSEDWASSPVGTANPSGWTTATGRWRVAQEGATKYAKSDAGSGVTSVLDRDGIDRANLGVTAAVRSDATGVGGVAVRAVGADAPIACLVDRPSGRLLLARLAAGAIQEQQSVGYAPSGWITSTVRLAVAGDDVTCAVDGGPTITTTVPGGGSGTVALVSRGNAGLTAITAVAL